MPCPYLSYRDGDGSRSFDVPRAYCTVVEEFVQPMRADVCNDRYDLAHDTDCEYYLAAEDDGTPVGEDGGPDRSDRSADGDEDPARGG